MGVILDTNALSAFADGVSALRPWVQQAQRLAIPVIVLGEYRFGVQQSRLRVQLEKWLDENLSFHQILDVNYDTALEYADLRVELKRSGTPIPSNDVWIAALSRQHRMPVLSRDKHFDAISGLRRLEW
jgi:tRNA(fMet)-specific endonuclease VapC